MDLLLPYIHHFADALCWCGAKVNFMVKLYANVYAQQFTSEGTSGKTMMPFKTIIIIIITISMRRAIGFMQEEFFYDYIAVEIFLLKKKNF